MKLQFHLLDVFYNSAMNWKRRQLMRQLISAIFRTVAMQHRSFTSCLAHGQLTIEVQNGVSIAAHYDYSPFGELLIQQGDLANTFTHRFSTKPYCHITKLVEYQMRKYRPEMGRWLSRNPIGEKGEWHGIISLASFSLLFGVTTMQVELDSNLTFFHKKHHLSLTAILPTASFGSPITATTGSIKYGDFEPEDFGKFVAIFTSGTALIGGMGASVVRIGSAWTCDFSVNIGFDLSVGGAIGRTLGYSMFEIPCEKW